MNSTATPVQAETMELTAGNPRQGSDTKVARPRAGARNPRSLWRRIGCEISGLASAFTRAVEAARYAERHVSLSEGPLNARGMTHEQVLRRVREIACGTD